MKTVREYLREEWSENGGHITKKAILSHACDRIGSYNSYDDIEGPYMAVYSYWDHNVEHFKSLRLMMHKLKLGLKTTQCLPTVQ